MDKAAAATSASVPGSGTTRTPNNAEPTLSDELTLPPPKIVKLPEYSANAAEEGTVISKIGVVTLCKPVRNNGVFKKNFVSSPVRGAAMFSESPFRKTFDAVVFVIVAVKVTI